LLSSHFIMTDLKSRRESEKRSRPEEADENLDNYANNIPQNIHFLPTPLRSAVGYLVPQTCPLCGPRAVLPRVSGFLVQHFGGSTDCVPSNLWYWRWRVDDSRTNHRVRCCKLKGTGQVPGYSGKSYTSSLILIFSEWSS
jgi:hypothetical protein